MGNRDTADPSTHTLSAILVYGGVCLALGAIFWSIVVAAGIPRERVEANNQPIVDYVGPLGPPSDAVLAPTIGAARDAALRDDVWYVLDRSGARVHRVDATGAHLGSFAGEGDGPGELRLPRAITFHSDTVVVAERRSIVLYKPDGTGIERRRIESPRGCSGASVADVASSSRGVLLLVRCSPGGEFEAVVVQETGTPGRQPLAARAVSPDDERVGTAFRDMAVLAAHPQGFVFGHPNDACLKIFDLDGQVTDSVCHDWIQPQPYTMGEGEDWGELHAAARSLGVTVQVPEFYPPFFQVFVGDDAGLVYATPIAGRVDLSRLVSDSGGIGSKFGIPPAGAVFLEGTSVLAAWYDADATWIRVYDADSW